HDEHPDRRHRRPDASGGVESRRTPAAHVHGSALHSRPAGGCKSPTACSRRRAQFHPGSPRLGEHRRWCSGRRCGRLLGLSSAAQQGGVSEGRTSRRRSLRRSPCAAGRHQRSLGRFGGDGSIGRRAVADFANLRVLAPASARDRPCTSRAASGQRNGGRARISLGLNRDYPLNLHVVESRAEFSRKPWQFDALLETPSSTDPSQPLPHHEVTRIIRNHLPAVDVEGERRSLDYAADATGDVITEDMRLLGSILGLVILEHAGVDFYRRIEELRRVAKLARQEPGGPNWGKLGAIIDGALEGKRPHDALRWLSDGASAFHILLALSKIAEAVHHHRDQRNMDRTLSSLTQRVGREKLREVNSIQLRLVATAHPTKLLRHRVLAHQADIFGLLKELRSPGLTNRVDQVALLDALAEKVEVLWATQFGRGEKPSASDDIAHTLTF